MVRKRSTQTYGLYDGNEKVYIGTTDDLKRREQEHRDASKKFTRIEPTSRRMTPDSAKKREAEQLETYRRGHKGKKPKIQQNGRWIVIIICRLESKDYEAPVELPFGRVIVISSTLDVLF